MPISYLTRIVEFSATHRIRRADWPDERNAQEFGRAAAEHGHRYQCRVTVKGPLAAEVSGVMSLEALDHVLAEEITQRLEGRSVNEALPEFADGRRLATGGDGGVRMGAGRPAAAGGRDTARGARTGGAAYLLGILR